MKIQPLGPREIHGLNGLVIVEGHQTARTFKLHTIDEPIKIPEMCAATFLS